MTSPIPDPGARNDLFTELVVALLDQAEEEFQGRTGQAVPMGGVQRLKVHAARRVATLAMKQLGRIQDPQERLRRLAALTDRYLPSVVEVLGEEAVQARLERLPERLRGPEVVQLCQAAGATELTRLLAGGRPVSKPDPAVVAHPRPVSAAPAPATVIPAERAGPGVGESVRVDLLRSQVALMETMQKQIEEALPRLRRALEEELARAR